MLKFVLNIILFTTCFTLHGQLQLGEYLNLEGHPKAKNVKIKLKVPNGWDIREGDRPNIVNKFISGDNVFLILIKDNSTFISRKQAKVLFEDPEFVNNKVLELTNAVENLRVTKTEVTKIDNYPALQINASGYLNKLGVTSFISISFWMVLFEDKVISFQGTGLNNSKIHSTELLFKMITNSVVFPEQYN